MAARSRRSVASGASGCVSEDISEDVQMSVDQDEDEVDSGSVCCKMGCAEMALCGQGHPTVRRCQEELAERSVKTELRVWQ